MRHILLVMVVIIALTGTAVPVRAEQDGPWQTYDTSAGEWRSYAGDIAGTKYSPLEQIDAGNFGDLGLAWEWTSVDNVVSKTMPGGGERRAFPRLPLIDDGLPRRAHQGGQLPLAQAARATKRANLLSVVAWNASPHSFDAEHFPN